MPRTAVLVATTALLLGARAIAYSYLQITRGLRRDLSGAAGLVRHRRWMTYLITTFSNRYFERLLNASGPGQRRAAVESIRATSRFWAELISAGGIPGTRALRDSFCQARPGR